MVINEISLERTGFTEFKTGFGSEIGQVFFEKIGVKSGKFRKNFCKFFTWVTTVKYGSNKQISYKNLQDISFWNEIYMRNKMPISLRAIFF